MPEPEYELPVTEEEYEKATSKWVTFPANAKVGDVLALDVEIGMLDWEQAGKSMSIPVVITEKGPDEGKPDKVSFGVKADGIWKAKALYRNITGEDMPMRTKADGSKGPVIKPEALAGKQAVGIWILKEGHKGGDPEAEKVRYPKLEDIVPAGQKPKVEDLGI